MLASDYYVHVTQDGVTYKVLIPQDNKDDTLSYWRTAIIE